MRILRGLAAIVLVVSAAPSAAAGVLTYVLPDIGSFASLTVDNVGQTYSGTGFVGMYASPGNASRQEFGHVFTIESDGSGRVNAQADISALAGQSIASATLSFVIENTDPAGHPGPQLMQVTGYSSDGQLGYMFEPPAVNYGSTLVDVDLGLNSVDVTDLLQASVDAGDAFLGLHLAGLRNFVFFWTFTRDPNTRELFPDAAQVRLHVVVPEPESAPLLGATLLMTLTLCRRRLKSLTSATPTA